MKNLALLIGIVFSAFCTSAFKISQKDYVEMWKDVAIGEMLDHKIPASITPVSYTHLTLPTILRV